MRDSLNASPRYLRSDDTPEKRLARQKEYIATVRQVQEAVEKGSDGSGGYGRV